MNLYTKLVLVLLFLAAAVWQFADTHALRNWLSSSQPANLRSFPQTAPAKTTSALRKCQKDETVVYTNSKCPPGSIEQTVSGGAVTVIKGQPAATVPNLKVPPIPHAGELLGQYVEPPLRDQQIEQVTQR